MRSLSAIVHRLQRRIILAGSEPGILGASGRLLSPIVRYQLPCGIRIYVDSPNEYIQRQLVTHGVYEPGIFRLIQLLLRPGDMFFDVGANIGFHSLVAAKCGAIVYAFEPVPRLAERLRSHVRINYSDNRVKVEELALSDSSGFARFYVAKRADDGSHSLIDGVPAERIESIIVRTETLDSYVQRVQCGIPTIVKIDVEGAEARVIDGAHEVLTAEKPPHYIIIETGDRLADRIGESARSVLTRLTVLGYSLFSVSDSHSTLLEIQENSLTGSLSNYLGVHKIVLDQFRDIVQF